MTTECNTCHATIVFVRTEANGKSMPLDPVPHPDGNVIVVEGLARVLGPLELLLVDGSTDRFMPHFATCTTWNEPPLVRNSDPETSRSGAADVKLRAGSQKARLLDAFAHAVDLTSEEAGKATGLADKPGCCYWHRVSDLAAAGLIAPTGETREASTGSHQQVYRITSKGLAVTRSQPV